MTMTPRAAFPARIISPTTWRASSSIAPKDTGFEREIAKRLEYWSKLRAKRAGSGEGNKWAWACLPWASAAGLGALARYYIAGAIQSAVTTFPWGIFVVNISGGLLMGLIVEASALKLNLSPDLRAFLTVGILGGYTTFSTFSLDSVLLLQKGEYAQAAYVIGSVVLSILALFAGLWIVRAIYA